MSTPNWDRFEAARERFREDFGHEVLFHTPLAATYPPGTALNSNGRPLDPTVDPVASGWDDASGLVNVVVGSVTDKDEAAFTAVGYLGEKDAAAIVPESLYQQVKDATFFTHATTKYRVTQRDKRVYGPTARWLIYGEQA